MNNQKAFDATLCRERWTEDGITHAIHHGTEAARASWSSICKRVWGMYRDLIARGLHERDVPVVDCIVCLAGPSLEERRSALTTLIESQRAVAASYNRIVFQRDVASDDIDADDGSEANHADA